MFYSTLLVAAAGLAGLATAQNTTSNGTSATGYSTNNTQSYPYYLTNAQIALQTTGDKTNWCLAQRNTCNQVCLGAALPNSCDVASLNWACTCTNFATPNITAYNETVPFYECQRYKFYAVQTTSDPAAQARINNAPCGGLMASNNGLPAGGTYMPGVGAGAAATNSAGVSTGLVSGASTATAATTSAASSAGSAATSATSRASSAASSAASAASSAGASASSAAATATRTAAAVHNQVATGALGFAGLLAFFAI